MSPKGGDYWEDRVSDSDTTQAPSDRAAIPAQMEDDEDPRLLAAMQEYMAAVESGKKPNRQEFLARHADIARDLSACIEGLAFVRSAAAQMPGNDKSPGHDVPVVDDADPESARPLGDFKLVREIGRGGMGVVYEAVQLSLGRRVAVKVLPFAAALDGRHLQRFKNEAQAAAQLHHTNIVPVYAVGSERGVHFYAMQLIEGESLAEVIAALRKSGLKEIPAAARAITSYRDDDPLDANPPEPASGDRSPCPREDQHPQPAPQEITSATSARSDHAERLMNSMSRTFSIRPTENLSTMRSAKRIDYFRYVAKLGLQAAEALDYAHQLGVVHRDVKPANLLLDVRGNLWITDFGLAQFYADTGLTQTGDLVGTYRYMSPEQASGRAVVLDQRTDVYSLGVTLYELLTLERALPGETREELLRQLNHEEPRALREIDPTIPVELETIFMKATAKEPTDRYASAKALAEDLRRFLDDEPILARPPTLWDKGVKWTRRHRSLALSAVAMLLMASVGLLISTLLIAREQSKTKQAYEQERIRAIEVEEQRKIAEKRFQQARGAVDTFASIAVEDMSDPGASFDVRRELLEAARGYYEEFLAERREDPTVSGGLAAMQTQVVTILQELASANEHFRARDRSRLLSAKAVQEELKLTTEQREKALQLWQGFERPPEALDFRSMTTEEKRAYAVQRTRDLEDQMEELLNAKQLDRLRQIARQVRGVSALTDSDAAEALSLSRYQVSAIRKIQSESRDGGPGFRGPPDHNRSDERARLAWAMQRALAVLSEEQAEKWKSMSGEPFTGDLSDIRFRGGSRGGRGGGPGEGQRSGPGPGPGAPRGEPR